MPSTQYSTNHITMDQAKQQKLHGSDTLRHAMYYDALHRDFAAIKLNEEALKAFSNTVVVSCRHALAAHFATMKEWGERGGFQSGDPPPLSDAMQLYASHANYENLKIACGFELHLKARLVANEIVVHKIDRRNPDYKALAREQEERPVKTMELFVIRHFLFDGNQNYLPGIKDTSLEFSQLPDEPEYRKALNLPDQDLDIIDYYRCLRNQIHLPNEPTAVPNVQFPGTVVDFLTGFINTHLIPMSNALVTRHQLRFQLLSPLS